MDQQQFEEIAKRLDAIIRLLTLDAMADKFVGEQVMLLSSAGFKPKDIAQILGKTPHAVSQALYLQRKQTKSQEDKGGANAD
jgi:DNA-directed RNA polymerase specialized sigma24 family protein